MNNKIKKEGDGGFIFQDISNAEIIINRKEPKIDKKPSSAQKFLPQNFPQNLIYFTGREPVLENIVEALQNHGTAAFADTHGVGKSSVVIEFAYREQETYKHILFIRATNNEFNIYVSEIVKDLGFDLPEDAKPEERLAVLQDWLAKNQDWLLLVDNVDDVDFIHKCGFNKPNGKVIYTSNDNQVYGIGAKIKLPKMLDENAILLLYKHWRNNPDAKYKDIPENVRQTLKGIAEKFDNHPFSMAFVGSYLAEEDESLEEFLEAYQSKEKNLLQNYEFLTDYHQKNVATAFLFRFEQISTPKDKTKREKFLSTGVKDYLKLSAFVGTDNIPEELLQESLFLLHPEQAEWTEDKDFIKDIYKRFKPTSIFKRDAENKTLTTHRIVQEIMRFQVKDEEDFLLGTITKVLADNFEAFEFTNKEKVEQYLIHVGVFLEYIEQNKAKDKANLKLENESVAKLCNNYARYYQQNGKYKTAEKYYKYFKDLCKGIKDIDQSLLAESYNNLALIYQEQGKYREAEPLYIKSKGIRERILNENHPDIAESYNNLGLLYYEQGKYKQAEPFFIKAIDIREKKLGNDHSDTAISYLSLAILYKELCRYEDAESLYIKAIYILEKKVGENHPHTAQSYHNLAVFYDSQSRFKEAEPLYIKAKDIRKKILGENHPLTASSYDSLAGLYYSQDKYKEVESLYRKSLEIRKKIWGENHPDTARSYSNLAVFYFNKGNLKFAKKYQRKAREIYLEIFGENHHPNTAVIYWWLGKFCAKEEKYQEALDHFYKAREIYLKFLPKEHPNVQNLEDFIDKCERRLVSNGKRKTENGQ